MGDEGYKTVIPGDPESIATGWMTSEASVGAPGVAAQPPSSSMVGAWLSTLYPARGLSSLPTMHPQR